MNSKIMFSKMANVKILIGFVLAVSLIVLFSCSPKGLAKSPTSHKYQIQNKEKVYQEVEQMPEYPGGLTELQKYLGSSVKYPYDAMKNKIQGKVYVSFVVGKDGSVKNTKVARGVDPLLDEEAMRVVNAMPKWTSGKEKGKVVAVQYTIPINFVLQ